MRSTVGCRQYIVDSVIDSRSSTVCGWQYLIDSIFERNILRHAIGYHADVKGMVWIVDRWSHARRSVAWPLFGVELETSVTIWMHECDVGTTVDRFGSSKISRCRLGSCSPSLGERKGWWGRYSDIVEEVNCSRADDREGQFERPNMGAAADGKRESPLADKTAWWDIQSTIPLAEKRCTYRGYHVLGTTSSAGSINNMKRNRSPCNLWCWKMNEPLGHWSKFRESTYSMKYDGLRVRSSSMAGDSQGYDIHGESENKSTHRATRIKILGMLQGKIEVVVVPVVVKTKVLWGTQQQIPHQFMDPWLWLYRS